MRDFVAKGMEKTVAGSDLRARWESIASGIEACMAELQAELGEDIGECACSASSA